jgi:lambda family phage portal protein
MGIFSFLKSKPVTAAPVREKIRIGMPKPGGLLGGYDAATITNQNKKHWANADGMSADAATTASVRQTLRNHARYEVANNTYAKGIVTTLANDTIGTGPRISVDTFDPRADRVIEAEWNRWAKAVNLAEKLRTMRMARAESGEVFAVLVSNEKVNSPIKLDLMLVEADRVTSTDVIEGDDEIDGIKYDAFGNPESYRVLKNHPGDAYGLGEDSQIVPAELMLHYFLPTRPAQHRGVPDIAPALPLFAQLRRYTLAVIAAAETAADFAGILYTDAPALGESDDVEPLDGIELESRTLLTMPAGWKMAQVRAEQPTTTYSDFKREILNEIARCLNMPFNVAAGNSSGYNYASGRLDHQTYHKAIRVERENLATTVLDRIFSAWVSEAILIEEMLPAAVRASSAINATWMFDGHEHVDPAKEANATATKLENNLTTLAEEYAKQGKDWETQLRQRALELELMEELGIRDLEEESAEAMQRHDIEEDDDDDA